MKIPKVIHIKWLDFYEAFVVKHSMKAIFYEEFDEETGTVSCRGLRQCRKVVDPEKVSVLFLKYSEYISSVEYE